MNDEVQDLRNAGYKPVVVGPQPFSFEDLLRKLTRGRLQSLDDQRAPTIYITPSTTKALLGNNSVIFAAGSRSSIRREKPLAGA
jgi:hypothetical protein